VFVVQGKPRKPDGIVKVVKETRQEALEAARDLLDKGMVIVTVIADGRVYTAPKTFGSEIAKSPPDPERVTGFLLLSVLGFGTSSFLSSLSLPGAVSSSQAETRHAHQREGATRSQDACED
jgi:hypothetical protein